jgi:hypothetical protein
MALDFNTEPYFDDYSAEKDFYRILFRPSYAVQARELTQIQTILQNQVTRFGDHVFKNGSQVIPGSVNADNQVHFIKLEQFTGTIDVTTYIETFKNKIVTGETSGVKMRVLDTTAQADIISENFDVPTLYCKVEGTASDNTTNRLLPGENIIAYEEDNQISTNFILTEDQLGDITAVVRILGDAGETGTTYQGDSSSDVLGYAYSVEVKAGIYYIDGIFVRNDDLKMYAGRFSNTPSCRVGFKVSEETVAPEDDDSILDNATGSYNFAAPGAHRWQIKLSLVKLPLVATDAIRFVELLRVVDGRIQHKIDKSSYAELEKTLARRTYDESGNYEVNKFKLSVREHLNDGTNFGVYQELIGAPQDGITYGNDDNFVLVVDPGKAYIQGYEIESTTSQFVTLDKAREINGEENNHVARLDDSPIGLSVGNWVKVKNLFQTPDITNFEKVYLVKTLSTAGNAPVASNIIGTARVKSIQLHSADYTAGVNTDYKLGLFDIKMYSGYSFEGDVKSITGIGATSTNPFTCDASPILNPLIGSATSSTASTTVTGVGTNFQSSLKAGDVLYLNNTYVGQVSSVTNNLTLVLTANAAASVTGGTVGQFTAPLQDPSYETLLFPIGYTTVKTLRGQDQLGGDTVKSSSIVVRRKFPNSSTAINKVSFEITTTNETFLSDSDLSNFLLIDNATHLPVNITTANITFDNDALRKRVDFAGVNNGSFYLVASVQQQNSAAQEKTKVLKDTWVETIVGKKLVSASTVELRKADALRLKSVRMTPGNYTAYDSNNSIDITERYTLDNGQRATHYTNAKLILKPGYQAPSGALSVEYDWFEVTASFGNYFSVDSYASVPYKDIPSFTITDPATGKKRETCLSDVLDFRPILDGENTFTPEVPKIGSDAQAPVAYYLGRRDKIVLDSIGRFNVIKGVPAAIPQEPEDPKEGMVLASLIIPPYTKTVSNVVISQRDNRRYTMRDIGKLDRRIANLEYYVTLNLLEKDTATMQIRDTSTGLDKFKNGFIVDQFTGHGIGDVKNVDYRVAVDSSTRVLRPMHFTTALEIVEDLASGGDRAFKGYKKTGDLITLPFTESDFIFNNNATRAMDIQAMAMGALKGQINLFPEGDNWKSVDRRPDLVAIDDNNYDAIQFLAAEAGVTGTKWNEWQTNWTSVTSSTNKSESRVWDGNILVTGYETTITNYSGYDYRSGINTSLSSTVNAQDYGDRVVDMSYIPYMRARPVTFYAQNLKAKTQFWPFFDNIDVKNYVQPADSFIVERTSNTLIDFNFNNIIGGILADDPRRAYKGKIEPSFSVGDVVTNPLHTAVSVQSVTNLTGTGYQFTLVVADTSNIAVGHHVMFYNMDNHNAYNVKNLDDLQDNQNIPASIGISNTAAMSKELNLKKFKVIAISGQQLTLANIDGSAIAAFSSYSTGSYTQSKTGMLYRLRASGVVVSGGEIISSDSIGPIQQEIKVVNIKNGFGVGDMLQGTVNIGGTTALNVVDVISINGNSSASIASTMKKPGDDVITDADGVAVGVFYLPETDELSFRTGERVFKLTDNQSNSNSFWDSIGSTTYYAQGISLSKERTIVSTRSAVFTQADTYEDTQSLPPTRRTTTSSRIIYQYRYDPLAQTFTVSSAGGVFVTSLDLYFSKVGVRPISVELRNTDNGVPSSKIIPFSEVTLNPSEINVSTNSLTATTFNFKSPIYLQEGETYAFVVKCDEPGSQVYVSEMGQVDMVTGNTIAGQPLTGSLYASQNAKEWEIHALLDIKFNLKKAKFQTNSQAEVLLKAVPPLDVTLTNNPFEITPWTNLVRVYFPNHGFLANELVSISEVADGYYGTAKGYVGIPAALLNRTHTVSASGLERDSFVIDLTVTDSGGNYLLKGASTSTTSNAIGTGAKTFTVGTGLGYLAGDMVTVEYSSSIYMTGSVTSYSGTSLVLNITTTVGSGTYASWKVKPEYIKGEYGGTTVRCSRSIKMDSMYLKTSDLSFQETKIDYYIQTEGEDKVFSEYLPVVANSNTLFKARQHICSYDNQTVISESPLQKKSSVLVKAILTSSNENVSPAIDLQKISAYSVTNRIDNDTASTINVAAIDTRTLLTYGDLVTTDIENSAPAGTITTTTASATVTGVGTLFSTQIVAGNTLHNSAGTLIGTVQSVNGSNTSLTLTGNAAVAVTGGTYKVRSSPTLYFDTATYNGETLGVIRTNIDTADNLLGQANVGKNITISNALTGVDGSYVVKFVDVSSDSTTYAGNTELDVIRVYVTPAFGATGNISMLTDTDFKITMQDKYVDDFAPIGSHNAANYITRTLALATAADQLKVIFDGSIVNHSDVKVYYRTWTGDVDLRKLPYRDTGFVNTTFDAENVFTERTIDMSGMTAYTNIQIKIVMKSSSATSVPMIKNLRILALS